MSELKILYNRVCSKYNIEFAEMTADIVQFMIISKLIYWNISLF